MCFHGPLNNETKVMMISQIFARAEGPVAALAHEARCGPV
jgi:hypothetical protein